MPKCKHSLWQCHKSYPASMVLSRAVCAFKRSCAVTQEQPRAAQLKLPSFCCAVRGCAHIPEKLRRNAKKLCTAPSCAVQSCVFVLAVFSTASGCGRVDVPTYVPELVLLALVPLRRALLGAARRAKRRAALRLPCRRARPAWILRLRRALPRVLCQSAAVPWLLGATGRWRRRLPLQPE